MNFSFDRPVGAPADVTELDYVSALHQTDVQGGIRKDGSIQDADISLFLSSRYGVQETPEQVREKILSGLGSTDGYMDMMQLVSLLLISILRQEQEHRTQDNHDNDLLTYTAEMMLHDVTGSRAPKPLTRTLIKQIFQAYGETELSENDELVQKMLDQAGTSSNGERVMLDAETFCRALTHDVQQFNVENKDKLSTNFDDVMFADKVRNDTADQVHAEPEESPEQRLERGKSTVPTLFNEKTIIDDVPLIYTAPQLDNVADTFRSRPLVVFQWTFFVLSFQTYLFKYLSGDFLGLNGSCPPYVFSAWAENADAFFCQVGVSLLKWIIIMLIMSVCGVLYFWLAGIGNFVECKNPLFPWIGTVFSLLCTLLPWSLIGRKTPPKDDVAREFLEVATYCLGGFAIFFSVWQFISLLLPKMCRLCQCCKDILVPEAIRTESRVKRASACKIDNMVANALEVHRVKKQETVVPTHFGQALLNFAELAPEFVRTGGLGWTWQMIVSRDLFRREGIIFSGRLLSTNFTQFALAPFILIFGIAITWLVGDEFSERVDDIGDWLYEYLYGVYVNLGEMTQSTETTIRASLATGTSIAFLTALTIAVAVLPSATTTIMKFRSGVIPFAADPRAKYLRIAPDQSAFIRGIMFWGALFASIIAGSIVAIIIFFLFWQVTTALALRILAMIIGALLVLLVHLIIVRSFRRVSSQAFYRKRPAVANLSVLTRECGFVALTQAFVIVRILKLLLTTILYVGRVDTPFLHGGRGQVGGFRVDREPYIFQMDLLQHEAHRHPYIETLGVMYLLKLRYGNDFCTFAGSCWRLIFVYVLMPWLSKYRAMRRPQIAAEEEEMSNDAAPMPPPLRAVTLVDPQAYALRAVSLVPVASGWAGGSANSFGGRLISGRGRGWAEAPDESFEEREEIRELKDQVRKLQFQLQLHELNPPSPALSRDHEREVQFDETVPKPGWEGDYEDYEYVHSPQPQGLDQDDMVARHYNAPPSLAARVYESDTSPPPPALKRKKSEGLPTLRPPRQVSWAADMQDDLELYP